MNNIKTSSVNKVSRLAISFLPLLMIGTLTAPVSAQAMRADSLAIRTDSVSIDIQKAITECENLVENYPNSDFTPSVLFQLMELYYRRASELYQGRMEQYEENLRKFEAGTIKVEPVTPRVSYNEVISVGYRILDSYPTVPFCDKIVYRLALCHAEEGNTERAAEYFQKIITEYRSSPYAEEAHFRLGEQYFDRRDYDDAIVHFSQLLESWKSPFFDMALYKLGWSYFSVNNFAKAISTFAFLIDDVSQVEKANTEVLGRKTADLRTEAISYTAECFAEYGGARRAEQFLKDFGEKDYSKTIFLRLAEIYQQRNAYEESNDTYAAILRIWPLYEDAPQVQAKIVENYLRMDNRDAAEHARENLVANYGPTSPWLSKYPEGEAREKALKLSEENLYILGTDAQARAQESKSRNDFTLAISRYQDFVEKFPDSPNAAKLQFYQAECYYELADYLNAAKAYEKVVQDFSKSEFAATAAYDRVLANFNQLSANTNATEDSTTFYLENFLGTGDVRPVKIPQQIYADVLRSCNDFAVYFHDDKKNPEVMMKYGEAFFDLGYFDLAQRAYTEVVNRGVETPFTIQAYSMIAQSAFKSGDFIMAEKWYHRIVDEFADSARYVEKAETMIASAKFKLAERLKDSGKIEYAAQAFENIAASTEKQEIAERALIESAVQYENVGNMTKAIIIYENLRYRFPNSAKVDETLFKAATLAEQLPDFNRAAEDYLELVRLRPTSIFAPRALFNAALCYENLQNDQKTGETYERYAQMYRDDPDRLLEALVKVGDLAYKNRDITKAKASFSKALSEYENFMSASKSVDEYYVAEAQFMLGEIVFDDYRKIELVQPLQTTLKKKQALFQEVLLAYKNAAKFQVADWTTAASFRIGAAFEEFVRAFVDSPRPSGLDVDGLTAYESQLKTQVEPLKKKALETYRANVTMAEQNNIQNDWIAKSRERAEKLTIELGLADSRIASPASVELTSKTKFNEK